MPKLSREEVEVTSILKNILDNYPAGSATLREILQNTDDAGAQTQTFILDTRSFDSDALVDPVLSVCQGPAIIATNDAYFLPKDWTAIKRIHNSSKTQDESSTGKYGLGFRSCYHITDNPHVLSDDNLLILDPHHDVEEWPGGFDLSTTRPPGKLDHERDTFAGHFAPFAAILKHDDSTYQGTAIRLPLRLPGSKSKIKSTPTSIDTARQMFRDFIQKELPESMLFLKHITTIELKEIDGEGKETILATAKIDNADAVALQRSLNRGREEENSHHVLTTTVQIGSSGAKSTRNWIIIHFVENYHTASDHLASSLGRLQAEVEQDMLVDKLLPHVALAIPVPDHGTKTVPDFHGRLFTLLPLPIITGFPLHINAVLALTSSRQNLRNAQDVVSGTREEFLVEWNRVMFSELVPKAWASLLEHLVAAPRTLNVFDAWPSSVATREGDPGYWFPLPDRLLEEAATRKVWPLRSERPSFSVLGEVVVAVEGEAVAPLAALESCNAPLVVAPARVFKLINESRFKDRVLAPETAQLYIKKNVSTLPTLDANTIKSICDYLASANNLELLLTLPIIPNVRGEYTALLTQSTYTMATDSEASVFGSVDRDLLAADSMSVPTRQLLLNHSACRIHSIQPADVARYLQKQVGTFGGTTFENVSEASVVDRDLLAADSMSAPTRQLLLNDSADQNHSIQPTEVAHSLQKQVGTFRGTTLANLSIRVAAMTVEWLLKLWSWLTPDLTHFTYTMVPNSEASVFGTVDRDLLATDSISTPTRQFLLNDSADRIHYIQPADVASYLQEQVGTFGGTALANVSDGVSTTTVEWLLKFWSWLDGWDKLNALVNDHSAWNSIRGLYALPLRGANDRSVLRLVGRYAVRPDGTDPEVLAALAALEVPVLHESMSNGSAVQRVSRPSTDVVFVLRNGPKDKSFSYLDQDTRKTLHDFFTNRLSNYLRPGIRYQARVTLDGDCRRALRTLPVFPIFNPGVRTANSISFDVALEGSCFVDESVKVIPNIRDTPFLDHSQGRTLHTALEESPVEGEIAVLQKAISPEAWSQQDQVTGLLAALVEGLIRRLNEVDETTRDRIGELAIVDVGGRVGRLNPKEVVDPNSELARLFDEEDEVLPIGEFAREGPGTFIHQLRSYGMLRNALTPITITERVTKIADPTKSMKDREDKASRLLDLIDSYVRETSLSTDVVAVLRNSAWIPIGQTFYRPSDCWDSRISDAYLCDMVLPRVPFVIESSHLREYLGWTRMPLDVVKKQLRAVLDPNPNRFNMSRTEDSDRVEALLKELASLFRDGRLSQDQIASVVEVLGDADWVPISGGQRVQARRSMLEPIYLGSKFHQVSASVTQVNGMQELLGLMGILKRPSLESLYSALQETSNELAEPGIVHDTRDSLIRDSIFILEETCRSTDGPQFDVQQLFIPTELSTLAPVPSVLFNDVGDSPPSPQPGLVFAHASLSPALAYTIGLRKISEEEFAQDEDDIDAFQMAEDLTARIQGVLTEYDIDHSSNEWIANADDARARSFTFLIDEAKFGGKRVLGGLTEFNSGPALVIHNDGMFSEEDFKGLGNIGRGGKAGDMDSIGRFGLGALSFYHFTELPLVISGDHLLLLDPSQRYLPRSRTGTKRTGIRVPLSICVMRYPDQLKPLEGLFGFRAADGHYNGTIFRFPLRTASQAAESKLSKNSFSAVGASEVVNRFYASASQSLFFTKSVEKVLAMRRDSEGLSLHSIWSVTASRKSFPGAPGCSMPTTLVELGLLAPNSSISAAEEWLIAQTRMDQAEFPAALQDAFPRYLLPSPSFGIAMNLSAREYIKESRLFATLPLPVSISLPIHIHATWILAQDRRSIRCDAPDADGRRTLDSEYNYHILENVLPGLYLRALAVIVRHYPKHIRHFWPRKSSHDLSRTVATAFYKQLISSTEPILLTVENEPIAPVDAILHHHHNSPAAVRKVLAELKVPNYVSTPHFETSYLDDWGSLRRDSPAEVATILRENVYVTALQRLWQPIPFSSSKFESEDILSVLDYLMGDKEPLAGIPLLLREDGQLSVFQAPDHPSVFASYRRDIAGLFGRSAVLSSVVPEVVAQKIAQLGVNVKMLDAEGMRELLRNYSDPITPARQKPINDRQREWHGRLLTFLARPTPPVKLEDLAKLPLLPTVGREIAISLDYANEDSVWWRSITETGSLTAIILQLDIVSVDNLPGELLKMETIDLPRILKLLARFEYDLQRLHERVNQADWTNFVRYVKAWVQPNYLAHLSGTDFRMLTNLPLFEGRRGSDNIPFVSSSQVLMMPSGVCLQDVARYLPNDTIFAMPSTELMAILRRGNDQHRILSFGDLLGRLQIPEHLPEGTDAEFTTLLRLITTYCPAPYHGRLVPDMNRVVRPADQLFDHRVELFSTTFENRPELFIHHGFRQLVDNLGRFGIKREVTWQSLLECIQAIDSNVRSGMEVGRRARWVWDYVNDAPQPIRDISFNRIRGLRFVPRHVQRHPSESDLDHYARELPAIVSFDELCRPEYASLVWTQRASFATPPTPLLKAVYAKVGEPTPPDVVRHLVALATQIGPARAQSPLLFKEIQRVYDWLKSNKDDVSALLQPLSAQPLWLNVDSHQDTWTWRSAKELVFDLQYDGDQHFDAMDFLTPYRDLLISIGAREYRYVDLPSTPLSANVPYPEKLRAGWNTLKQKGRLFDVCFKVEGQEIQAHRGMLAAVVPHFMTAFAGDFQESTVKATDGELSEYRLPREAGTSAFAIKALVDYVYSGNFTPPTCLTSEEASVALENLLSLLELSNIWDVPELKEHSVKAIVELRLVRVETCDAIIETAEACQAKDLAQVCRETKAQNNWK